MVNKTPQKWRCIRGQAMPLGIALVLFSVLIGIALFNTGQMAITKTRVANTADSAAYSALLWQSRALNFQSYTNRAMVANQVSMAQAVSLRSWSLYGQIAAENVDTLLASIPYVGALSSAMASALLTVNKLVDPLSDALLAFVNTVNGVLSQSQDAMYASAFSASPDIVKSITRNNDKNFKVSTTFSLQHLGKNLKQWRDFTQSYGTDDKLAMQERADIINRSRDSFTTDRNWEFFNHWLYIAPFAKVKLHKRGETRLIRGDGDGSNGSQWEWKGKDTLSFNTRIWRPFRSDKTAELPIGWGQALANPTPTDASIEASCRGESGNRLPTYAQSTSTNCAHWFDYNHSAETLSDNNVTSLSATSSRVKMDTHYAGIRAYRALNKAIAEEKDPTLVFRVEVESPLDKMDTSIRQGVKGVFTVTNKAAAGALASIASAEVYFKKPILGEQQVHTEYANAYNPFWDVRLSVTPDQVRAQALAIRGIALTGSNEGAVVPGSHSVSVTPPGVAPSHTDDASLPSASLDHYPEVAVSAVELAENLNILTELGSLLDGAAQGLISAALPGSGSGSVEADASTVLLDTESAYNDINSVYQEQTAAIEPAAAHIAVVADAAQSANDAVVAEFQRIRQSVVQRFEEAAAVLDVQAEDTRLPLSRQMADLTQELADDPPSERRTEIESVLSTLREQLQQLEQYTLLQKASRLVDIVNSSTALYQLDLATALYLVQLEGDVGESLDQILQSGCDKSNRESDGSQEDQDCGK